MARWERLLGPLLYGTLRVLAGEGLEGGAVEAVGGPVGHGECAEGLVEVDGGGVPVEDAPFDAAVVAGEGELGEVAEEGCADALVAVGWLDVDFLEVEAGAGEEGGEGLEEDGVGDEARGK